MSSAKRNAVRAGAAGMLSVVAGLLTAAPALAYHLNYGTNGSGGPVPVGTTYALTTDANGLAITNSSGGKVWACTSSELSGQTTGSGGVSSGLNVEATTNSGTTSFTKCSWIATGQPFTFSGNFSPAWQITITGGGPSPSTPFTGTLSNMSLTIGCGSNSETFSGTLSTGLTWTNAAGAAGIGLANAQSLSEASHVGSGCGLPGPYGVTARYVLTELGGKPVSASNNFWLLQN